jgi:hypothetical protein
MVFHRNLLFGTNMYFVTYGNKSSGLCREINKTNPYKEAAMSVF